MAINNPILEVSNLTKKYGNLTAVKDLDLTVEEGTIHGFLGPNGAGKTTTIRCILGLLKPNAGHIKIFGKPVGTNNVDILKQIGYLPGDVSLYTYYTVKELFDYFQALRHLKHAPLREDLVKRLDIDESKPVKTLSKGNRQKAGIVLAFMHNPDLLVLDEPTSGLDPLLQNEFYKILAEFRDAGKTIFFSSHVLSEVDRLCDKVSLIRNGELVSTEDIADLSMKIGRRVILKFKKNGNTTPVNLPNMKFIEKNGDAQIYLLQGNTKQIIQTLNDLPNLEDFSIPEPNVEDYFMQFYENK